MKREHIKGFTVKIGQLIIETVYHRNILNLKVIALNWKTLNSKTFRILDLK